jgi:hypothetical protein
MNTGPTKEMVEDQQPFVAAAEKFIDDTINDALAKADERVPEKRIVNARVKVGNDTVFILMQIDDGQVYSFTAKMARQIADALRHSSNQMERELRREEKMLKKEKKTILMQHQYRHH